MQIKQLFKVTFSLLSSMVDLLITNMLPKHVSIICKEIKVVTLKIRYNISKYYFHRESSLLLNQH